MYTDSPATAEVSAILRAHRIDEADVELAGGFANRVMMTPEVVVRLNEGRFPQAFAHEARVLAHLPDTIPHPKVVAQGQRGSGGEYLILERLPGQRLDLAWPMLDESERARIAGELATIVRHLHTLPVGPWMDNPWVEDVVRSHRWRDAYRVPPAVAPLLIEGAAAVRPEQRSLLDRVAAFVDQRMPCFDNERTVFLHTDLHFRNILVDDARISGLIDYEGSRRGSADVELDMFLRSMRWDKLDIDDARGFVSAFHHGYPELFAHPRLVERLEVYEVLWHLVQFHHWKPGDSWTSDPAVSLDEILDGRFAAQGEAMLAVS